MPDRVSNPGPLTYESGALPIALRGPADDLLNIDNNFFDSMVNHIYPSELQLNKVNISDTEASLLDFHLSLSDGFVKIKNLINGMIVILIL